MRITKFLFVGSVLLALGCRSAVAPQAMTITGAVHYADGTPVAKASVSIRGQAQTLSDDEGRYTIRLVVVPGTVEIRATDENRGGARAGTNYGTAQVEVHGGYLRQDIVLDVFQPI